MTNNNSGIIPTEYRVLVKLDEIEIDPVMDSARRSGINIPDYILQQEMLSQVKAELIAIGGNAFDTWKGSIPQVGQKIIVSKYAGVNIQGRDGLDYRLCNDKDIVGIILEDL